MFNFFSPSTAKDYQLKSAGDYKMTTPRVDEVNIPSKHTYSVGIDNDGNTALKLQNNFGTTTLTLNEHGVRQLIRMLEATLPPTQTIIN